MKTKTLTDIVYDSIKEDIIKLKLKPGEKLSEANLAERFGMSRAPIRNALAKLEQDKWVVIRPQIGTIVALLSEKKAIDIMQVRLLLEPFAAGVAAELIDDEDREILRQAFRNLEHAPKQKDLEKRIYFETDSILHHTIWKWCGNSEIYTILDNYSSELTRIQVSNSELADRMAATANEIFDIFHALLEKAPERAREAMHNHILNIKNTIAIVLDVEA